MSMLDDEFLTNYEKYQSMTLKDVLAELPKSTPIRIGAAANWFFFGTASDIEDICNNSVEKFEEQTKRYDKLLKQITNKENELTKLYEQKLKLGQYLKNYTPALERTVSESYGRDGEIYFIVEGTEVGKFWTREEYEEYEEEKSK